MQTFSGAPHHDVLALLVQVAVLLLTARALAEIAQRFGQPAVVGEILAGIVLGPSLLSGLVPAVGEWIVPQSAVQGYLLEAIAMVGAMFLLLITGLETDLALIRRHARVSMGASIGGIVVPFATGYLLGEWLPADLLADPRRRLLFSLFLATAMSISAIPVIAKVLMDLKLMRRDIGQAIIAAGMTDDAVGWMLLSIVLGLAARGEIEVEGVVWAVGKVIGFVVLSFTLGVRLARWLLDLVQDRARSPTRMLTLVAVLTFAWGAVSQALALEAVFGAFVMGIVLGQMPRLPGAVRHDVERLAMGIFAPIFFAVAGLKVNAGALLRPDLIGITLLVIAVACVGKVLGGYGGARWIGGAGHWEALSFGAGMNARGAMEIIIATIGLSIGILTREMFSIIVVMAITTSLLAPPALRWTLSRVRPTEQERRRLQREELDAGSLIAGVRRVLIPVRWRAEERRAVFQLEAHLLNRLADRNPVAATVFTVASPGRAEESADFLDRVTPRFRGVELSRKVLEAEDPTREILAEAAKDYDLMLLGAPETAGGEHPLFNERIDQILRMAPCSTVLVRGRVSQRNWPPARILLPTNGTRAARLAADLAFVLAGDTGEVLLVNVLEEEAREYRVGMMTAARSRQRAAAEEIVEELRAIGEAQGVRTRARVEVGAAAETTILEVAARERIDLVVLGTSLYTATSRVHLGPRLEHLLNHAPCPAVILNSV